MNDGHDYTFCADWDDNLCPQTCFRARITKELFDEPAEVQKNLLLSWANFRTTSECQRTMTYNPCVHRLPCGYCDRLDRRCVQLGEKGERA